MIYAQVSNNIIVNTIVLSDSSLLQYFQKDLITGVTFDMVSQIDQVYPQPGIGWIWDNISFNPPPVIDPDGGAGDESGDLS